MPERLRPKQRIDRHPYYWGTCLGLFFAAFGILSTPLRTGAIAQLDPSTQQLFAACMFVGAGLCLVGLSIGPPVSKYRPFRWWFPNFQVRHAYLIGAGGNFALTVALGFFGISLLDAGSLVGTATGLLTPLLSLAALRLGIKLWREHHRLDLIYNEVKDLVILEQRRKEEAE